LLCTECQRPFEEEFIFSVNDEPVCIECNTRHQFEKISPNKPLMGPIGPIRPPMPMDRMGPMGPMELMGPMGPMELMGPLGLMNRMGLMGPMQQMGPMGQMQQMGPMGQMQQMGPMGQMQQSSSSFFNFHQQGEDFPFL